MASNDMSASGWDAINIALRPIYGDQEPKHFGTVIDYRLGGPDPLRGISAYKRSGPIPHWHYITYGFSELYGKESENKAVSGWGFELTLRLKTEPDSVEPPVWVLNLLQNLARYVFKSGHIFESGHYMNANGPIALEIYTSIRSMAFVEDPELGAIDTPNGHLQFLQIVGITDDEELALKQWATLKALDVFRPHLPLLVTDLDRASLLVNSEVKQALENGAVADGSNTGALFIDQLSWSEDRSLFRQNFIQLTFGARQVAELKSLLPYRIPYQRPFQLIGQQCQIAITPSEANSYQADGNNLTLNLSTQSATDLAASLVPKEGLYEFPSFPQFRIQVKKTFIKDQEGKIVQTIG